MADQLSEESRRRLLDAARHSVEAAVRRRPPPPYPSSQDRRFSLEPVISELIRQHDALAGDPELQLHCGAFVTLKSRGRLRGCIGQFIADQPLWQVAIDRACHSATKDYRFDADPITPAEVPQLTIEISVLSPMEKIDDPLAIELGVHGIYVVGSGGRAGTYLPQVATEHHMSKEEFLSSCCAHKAGLRPDAWRTGEADVFVYTAEVFGEQ